MGKLKEFVTAAGLSVFLTASALGQEKQDIDLKAIEADSISITTTDGRVVFNRASAPEGTTVAPQAQTTTQPVGRRGTTTQPPQEGASRRRTVAAQTGTNAPTTTPAATQPETSVHIGTLEDCLTISTEFVTSATNEDNKQRQQATPRGERATTSSRTAMAENAGKTYVATCFEEGKPVAKITFGSGKTRPVVELIQPERPAPSN